MPRFENLIKNASIQIYEYGIDYRTEMNQYDRVFPFYVMSYISEGQALLRLDNREIMLDSQSVIIVPPGKKHDHVMLTDKPTVFRWWHFDYKLYDTIDILRLLQLPLVYHIEDNGQFETVFRQYREAVSLNGSLKNALHRQACTFEVMAHLLGAAERLNSDREIRSEIPEAFQEIIVAGEIRNLTLNDLSRRFNMHPTYISNRFAGYYGVSPIKLYRRLQLERAMEILSSDDKNVSEVAEMFGYTDVSAFSRAFVAQMGFSPAKVVKNRKDR